MRTLLIDDNEIDRLNLRTLLEDYPQIGICGEAHNVSRARALIMQENPDLIFLDIHLGQEKGFEVLQGIENPPRVVFTTAHSEYALQGFEVGAVDYIVKPADEVNLARAIQRLPRHSSPTELETPHGSLALDSSIALRRDNEVYLRKVSEIVLLTTSKPLTAVLLCDGSQFLHRNNLRTWVNELPANSFLQLGRSHLVNTQHIDRFSVENQEAVLHFNGGLPPLPGLKKAALKSLRNFFQV